MDVLIIRTLIGQFQGVQVLLYVMLQAMNYRLSYVPVKLSSNFLNSNVYVVSFNNLITRVDLPNVSLCSLLICVSYWDVITVSLVKVSTSYHCVACVNVIYMSCILA